MKPARYFDPKDPPAPEMVGLAVRNPDDADLKVYVASGWSDRTMARSMMEACQAAGFAITYDWTDEINVSAFSSGAKPWCAERDLAGVQAADVLVVLEPASHTCGMWVELGIALARRRPGSVLFVPSRGGEEARASHEDGKSTAVGGGQPFISHSLVTVLRTVDEVIPTLRGIALGRGQAEF